MGRVIDLGLGSGITNVASVHQAKLGRKTSSKELIFESLFLQKFVNLAAILRKALTNEVITEGSVSAVRPFLG